MKVNVRRWAILIYLLGLMAFSLHVLLIPGEKYKLLTTSDSGYFAGIAEELDQKNGFIERYSRSHSPDGWPTSSLDQAQPLLAVLLYRGASSVLPGVGLMDVINYWSPLLFCGFLVLVFLITRELAGDLAGCAAAFFASVLVGSIYWCKFAAFDREALITVLSCATVYLGILTFKHSSPAMGVLAGLAYSLLVLSWGGWSYLTPVILGALLLLLLHDYLLGLFRERRPFSLILSTLRRHQRLILGIVCLFITVTVVSRMLGSPPAWSGVARTLLGYVGIGGGYGGGGITARYASEMAAPGSFGEILSKMYFDDVLNRIAVVLLGLGILKVLWTRRRWEWILLPWLVILMGLVWPGRGQARFDRLWWSFVVVAAGAGVGALVSGFRWLTREWHEAPRVLKVLPFLLVFLFLPFANNAIAQAQRTAPPTEWAGRGFDQAYTELCHWLENNTPPSTTVAIEWSYGHLLTGASGRRSVSDGVECLGREGEWENDPNLPAKPPDYIIDRQGRIYGVDTRLLDLEPYRIYGRRTDVLRIPYMDSAELAWFLWTYWDNFGVKIDYLALDFWDYWNASWVDRNLHFLYTVRSPPLRNYQPPSEERENLLILHFGENRENVVINYSTQTAYLQVREGPDLLFDGYIEASFDEEGNFQQSTFYSPPRPSDLPETVLIWKVGGSVRGAQIYRSRVREVEARGPSMGVIAFGGGGEESRPDFVEPAFFSSNFLVVLLRVLWDRVPLAMRPPPAPKGGTESWSAALASSPGWFKLEELSSTIRSPSGYWSTVESMRSG